MNKKSKVILLPCNSYREEIVYENLEIGLELLGGIENIVGKEESVLLKPNDHTSDGCGNVCPTDERKRISGYGTCRFLRKWNNF